MKFRTRIWALPVSAAVIFTIGVIVSVVVGTRTSSQVHTLKDVETPSLELLLLIDREIDQYRQSLQAAAAEGDASALKDSDAIAAKVLETTTALGQLPGKQPVAKVIGKAFEDYSQSAKVTIQAMLDKKDASALQARMLATQSALDQVYKAQEKSARTHAADGFLAVDSGVNLNIWVGVATGVVVFIFLGVASYVIVASVWRDLGGEPETLRALVQRVAQGDLDVAVPVREGDSTSLSAAVAIMVRRLAEAISAIQAATETISTASAEIATGNQDLSSRTEHTAANLQQTAASVERLTESVRGSAASANAANELASSAMSAAEGGGRIVSDVVGSMKEINASSRKITEIIAVIDSIAFQTNILALNAAVEAARAGEQGRGFAVVAGEVRGLAQRCAQAAREVKQLITCSGEQVESGARLVNDAGKAMQEILDRIGRVTHIISEIGHATAAQSDGIGEVNQAIGRLDQMTQQNAALVEQSAAAAESLHEQTVRLTESTASFHLGDEARMNATLE